MWMNHKQRCGDVPLIQSFVFHALTPEKEKKNRKEEQHTSAFLEKNKHDQKVFKWYVVREDCFV